MISGLLVRLRALSRDDTERMRSWRNDPLVNQGLIDRAHISAAAQERWFQRVTEAQAEGSEIWFIVETLRGRAIGATYLTDVDGRAGTAQWNLFIGDAAHRHGGWSVDTAVCLFDHAFGDLGLRRIWCRILESNQAAQALNRRLGFREEGRLREHVFVEGTHEDLFLMGLTRDEWDSARGPVVAMLGQIAASLESRPGTLAGPSA